MKERKSNFELLRIISMIAIVLFHYVGHGGLAYASLSVNQVLAQFLKIGGKLGVNCFVMISAYFLIDSKFSSKKVVAIAGETTFYALLTVGVKCFFEGCSIQQLVKCFFAPVYDEIYWFPVAYLGLYLIFPFINSWLKANKTAIPKLFWLLTIVFCGIQFFFVNSNYLFSNIAWFIYLYILTALIKLSPNDFLEKWAKYLFMISVALIFLSSLVLKLLGAFLKIHFLEQHMYYFSDMTSPLMLIASVSL
ncbi:MAG: acyltransferase family protein, partial [Monoglobaceae bacterium]